MARRRFSKALMALGALLLVAAAAIGAMVAAMNGAAAHPDPDPEGNVEPGAESPVDWDYWKGINPDVIGWVRVPGTDIDQPLVQAHADDPQHYLTHDVYDNFNLWGVPYVDAECAHGIDSWNVVAFGHNMTYPPAMFHDFQYFADEAYAAEHAAIEVYTPEGARHLAVAGSDTVNGWEDVKRTEFAGADDFWGYRAERLDACKVKLGHGDDFKQMFTFCTCSYYFNPSDERTLVYAM